MSERIIDAIELGGRHTRSIALSRDLRDESAVENYLPTPNAIGALKQIGEGLDAGNAQRAWKIVGPYGSGKSALGVMIAHLLSGHDEHPAAWELLNRSAPRVAALFQRSRRFPLAVVGARVSLGSALASAIGEALSGWPQSKAAVSMGKQLNEYEGTYKSRPLNAVAGELVADFAGVAQGAGFDGVVLLVDEVGKFVEYAALYPEQGDLIALQQIAEQACRADNAGLAVVAMLHQHFASYAAGVGRALSDEWHKVASRFEEIPFDEPIERYAHFAVHAIRAKPRLAREHGLADDAREIYAKALEYGVLRAPMSADQRLFERAEQLYPLHPLSIAALAVISKRYGQSERSFHAFLRGNEPFALRDFSERNGLAERPWYRLPELFDYLAGGYGLRFRDLAAERRWAFAVATIERQALDPSALRTLKSIAVMELVQGGVGIPITAGFLAFALGDVTLKAISTTLERLVEQGLLVHRRNRSEFSFAVSDAINVEALYEQAARVGEDELIVRGISEVLAQRLVVANKHYDTSGTIRTMRVIAGSPAAWPQIPACKGDDVRPDGWLKLVLVTGGADAEAAVRHKLKSESDELVISACLPLSAEGRAALAEYSIWLAVQREVTSKRLDPWTSQYVGGRVHDARESVGRLVLSELNPFPGRPGCEYWYKGKPIPGSRDLNVSQLASWLFDSVYCETPKIVNELINKDRPAPAIVVARQRLFDVLISGDPSRQICAPNEYPPERLIHSTLLRDTGIWREGAGGWKLVAPTAGAPVDITAVWSAISETLRADTVATFASVMERLASAPLGVRAGPAGIWAVLYLMVHRSNCAVFERGTLVLELTAEHLQRMFRNPQSFELRELAQGDRSRKLLHDYRVAMSAIGCVVDDELTWLELARSLYRWFGRLPEYSLQTGRLEKDAVLVRSVLKKAQDPIKLLTVSLPELHSQTKSKSAFVDWLSHTLSELGIAHRRLQDAVSADVGRAFEISGPLSRVRNQLQTECAGLAADLADARLKSFILRCTDLSLTDEKWLDSIANLVVQRSLDAWTDETLGRFSQSLTELCGQYKRWVRLVSQRSRLPRSAERFVGLTLTMPGGQEASLFVNTTEQSKTLARNVVQMISDAVAGDHQLAAAALAQALQELQSLQMSKLSKEESTDGKREAR
ncbi:hypothetical protein VOI32_00900 [Paraburkholderia caribensis]|uniref:ATP-binding protein n=1 Tax=Paraburkholderia caribensis TaxID=75105 RepID=A0A9Q6WKM0_9BURK|nr:hypothetical protein [Paraburkholderia caribensis]MCO4875587.1 hypothetical protein [Paraburkholderia caribensis]PTB30493.1 hypothetical protein C9I56_01725 [Paraburkholderia caribensis]QLB62265.1 hypothetical protein A9O66_07650 [Paraburkholderia caribensis]